jgi:hypothetical protein
MWAVIALVAQQNYDAAKQERDDNLTE